MGQEAADSETASTGLPEAEAAARSKPLEYSYTRDLLLSFSNLECCKKRPENLDPVVWRDAPAADGADGGIAIPAIASRGLARRDRDGEAFSKSPVDIPEWRKDSWRSGGSGAPLQQGPRRKPYDEEAPGSAFSASYPPRPAGSWGDGGHPRNAHERSGLQGQASGRWEHRGALGDREREQGRLFQKWDAEEIVPLMPVDAIRPEGPRFGSGGPLVRPGWMPAERDGLLGSGGGLHRTYTGNFSSPNSLRVGPERQMSMGPLDRQMSMGPLDRQVSMGPLDRQVGMMPLDRQNSMVRGVAVRNSEPFHPPRPSKAPAVERREDTTDFVNDETFGSKESATDNRAEQERKRREAFELMRKDHQRQLQLQQKVLIQKQEERLANPESNANRKHDESTLWDSTLSSAGISSSAPHSPLRSSTDPEEAITSAGSIPVVASSTPRPAIPPGFAKVMQPLQTTSKASSINEVSPEEVNIEGKDDLKQTSLQSDSAFLLQDSVDDASTVDNKLVHMSPGSLDQQKWAHSGSMTPSESLGLATAPVEAPDNISEKSISGADASEEKGDDLSFRIDNDKKQGNLSDDAKDSSFSGVDEYNNSRESLLDKLLGKSKLGQESAKDGVLPLVDEPQNKSQEKEARVDSRISKFAQWFPPEEIQSVEGVAVSSDIMSLLSKGSTMKASSSLSEEIADRETAQKVNFVNVSRNPRGRVLPMPSGPSLEDIEKGLTASANATSGHEQSTMKESNFLNMSLKNLDVESKGHTLIGVFGEHSPVGKFKFHPPPAVVQSASGSTPVYRTCEDIEQSMLAEASTSVEKNVPKAAQQARAGGTVKRKDGQGGGQAADIAASRHLLSLLQKGAGGGKHSPQSSWSSLMESHGASVNAVEDGYQNSDGWGPSSTAQEVGGHLSTPDGENPTLEALFGKAFMNELRSLEVPVSAKTYGNDVYSNMNGTQAVSGMYPISRQPSGRVVNSSANPNVSKPWPGTIGPLSRVDWTENNNLEASLPGHLTDVPVQQAKVNKYMAHSKDESGPISSSGRGLWGNGVNMKSHVSDGGLAMNSSIGMKGSFVSSVDSMSHVLNDATDSSIKGEVHMNRIHNSDLDTRTGSKVNGEGKSLPSVNFMSGQLRVSEDSTFAFSQAEVISSDEPISGPNTTFDSSGLLHLFKEDGLAKRLVGDGSTAKFAPRELSVVPVDEKSSAVSQGIENFLSGPQKVVRRELLENALAGDKIGGEEDVSSGNDRKMADTLSDTFGFIGKMKDGSTGLARTSSSSIRFKSKTGAMQPPSGFSAFQPVSPPLQRQQSSGSVYRSEPSISLQSRQQSLPVHHPFQQSTSSTALPMFAPQQFHPQPVLPQQQPLLPRTFSNGSSLEFPHVAFGHAPTSAPNRQVPAGQLHFAPTPHGHLSPPGAYHPLGHMGPTPNHFLPSPQMPHRGPVMSPMAEAHILMQEQSLHDLHGLGSKPGPQQGPPLYPIGGHALQSGQGPMFHQPLSHNLRGQQSQLVPGPGQWVMPYSSDLLRTASKGHELAGYTNGSGVGGGPGANAAFDRWFGMELSRNVSGIPNPSLVPSPPGLDSESKMRFG